jgi:hypothetical protein
MRWEHLIDVELLYLVIRGSTAPRTLQRASADSNLKGTETRLGGGLASRCASAQQHSNMTVRRWGATAYYSNRQRIMMRARAGDAVLLATDACRRERLGEHRGNLSALASVRNGAASRKSNPIDPF